MTSHYPDASSVSSQQQLQRVQSQSQPQSIAYQGFDPDDMELDVDQTAPSAPSSGAPSPPDTPNSMPLSGYPSPTPSVVTYSAATSSHPQPTSPISVFDTATVLPARGHHHHPHHHPHDPFRPAAGLAAALRGVLEDAFNASAGYADYSSLLPGPAPLGSGPFMQQSMTLAPANGQNGNGVVCTPMALLLSGSAWNTSDSTPTSSRVALLISGGSGSSGYRASANAKVYGSDCSLSNPSGSGSGSGSGVGDRTAQTVRASTTLSRPASSLLLSKSFKCPTLKYNKSYQQTNGLKCHMTHKPCNFAPPKDLEHLQELLACERSEKAQAGGMEGGEMRPSDAEPQKVEKEVERRLGSYACGIGECQRRYKNMNNLRYHYQHSGDHGAIGLTLLASGQHECLQHNKSGHATPSHSNSNSNPMPSTPHTHSRAASQHSSLSLAHDQAQAQPQPQYAAPQQLPTYQSALASPPAYSHQPNAYAPQQYAHQHYMPQS